MPHVDLTEAPLPNNDETAESTDVSLPIIAILAVLNGHIDTTNIEPGGLAWSVMGALDKDIPGAAMEDDSNLKLFRDEANYQFIISGLIWTTLTGLDGQMTAGVLYAPDGSRTDALAIASKTFTASKDTYVSISPSGSVSYQEVANSAAPPTLTANYQWVARVRTSGSAITNILSLRQLSPFGLGFFAQMTAATSLTTATWTKLGFNDPKQVNGLVFDVANNRMIAPREGWYQFSTAVNTEVYSSSYRNVLALYVNGTRTRRLFDGYLGNGDAGLLAGAAQIYLSKNDYVEVWGYHAVGVTRSFGGTTAELAYFSGNLLG